jgi:hypothetical protein
VKRNFDQVMKDPDGKPHVKKVFKTDERGLPVLDGKVQEFSHFEPMTLRDYALDAVSGRWPGEDKAPWTEVKKRGEVIDKLMLTPHGEDIELDSTQVQIIKDALERQGVSFYVMYRIGTMLDTDPAAQT